MESRSSTEGTRRTSLTSPNTPQTPGQGPSAIRLGQLNLHPIAPQPQSTGSNWLIDHFSPFFERLLGPGDAQATTPLDPSQHTAAHELRALLANLGVTEENMPAPDSETHKLLAEFFCIKQAFVHLLDDRPLFVSIRCNVPCQVILKVAAALEGLQLHEAAAALLAASAAASPAATTKSMLLQACMRGVKNYTSPKNSARENELPLHEHLVRSIITMAADPDVGIPADKREKWYELLNARSGSIGGLLAQLDEHYQVKALLQACRTDGVNEKDDASGKSTQSLVNAFRSALHNNNTMRAQEIIDFFGALSENRAHGLAAAAFATCKYELDIHERQRALHECESALAKAGLNVNYCVKPSIGGFSIDKGSLDTVLHGNLVLDYLEAKIKSDQGCPIRLVDAWVAFATTHLPLSASNRHRLHCNYLLAAPSQPAAQVPTALTYYRKYLEATDTTRAPLATPTPDAGEYRLLTSILARISDSAGIAAAMALLDQLATYAPMWAFVDRSRLTLLATPNLIDVQRATLLAQLMARPDTPCLAGDRARLRLLDGLLMIGDVSTRTTLADAFLTMLKVRLQSQHVTIVSDTLQPLLEALLSLHAGTRKPADLPTLAFTVLERGPLLYGAMLGRLMALCLQNGTPKNVKDALACLLPWMAGLNSRHQGRQWAMVFDALASDTRLSKGWRASLVCHEVLEQLAKRPGLARNQNCLAAAGACLAQLDRLTDSQTAETVLDTLFTVDRGHWFAVFHLYKGLLAHQLISTGSCTMGLQTLVDLRWTMPPYRSTVDELRYTDTVIELVAAALAHEVSEVEKLAGNNPEIADLISAHFASALKALKSEIKHLAAFDFPNL